jgi:catechol 2,3-dioxygenase-like lactoylglutathione lyase family enzyme
MARLIVNVDVPDLDRGVRFYTEALGLRVGRRFDGSGIELVGAECPVYLLVTAPGSAPFRGADARPRLLLPAVRGARLRPDRHGLGDGN